MDQRGGEVLYSSFLRTPLQVLETLYASVQGGVGRARTSSSAEDRMYPVRALRSAMKPWRPMYAYACCYLLPFSLALQPAIRTALNSSPASSIPYSNRIRSSSSRSRSSSSSGSSSSRNIRWNGSHSIQGSGKVRSSSSHNVFYQPPSCVRPLASLPSSMSLPGYVSGSISISSSPLLADSGARRGFAARKGGGNGLGRPGRRRGGGALSMGKGSDRKKAKKMKVRVRESHFVLKILYLYCCVVSRLLAVPIRLKTVYINYRTFLPFLSPPG